MSCNTEEAIILYAKFFHCKLISGFQGSVGPEANSNSARKDQEAFYISSEEQVRALSVQVSQALPCFSSPLQFYHHSYRTYLNETHANNLSGHALS